MASLKFGHFHTEVVLDERSQRTHCGPRDKITGHALLKYQRRKGFFGEIHTADWHGPIKVDLELRGKMINIAPNESAAPIRLLSHRTEVDNGYFHFAPGTTTRLPFSINFPSTGITGERLPPTIDAGLLRPRNEPNPVEITVRYKLGVQVSLPGISMHVTGTAKALHPHVLYSVPRPLQEVFDRTNGTFKHEAKIQSRLLLPELERPSKFKSLFAKHGFPTLAGSLTCKYPLAIHDGQRLSFDLFLHRAGGTAEFLPSHARIQDVTVKIRACAMVGRASDVQTLQILYCNSADFTRRNMYSTRVTTRPVSPLYASFRYAHVSWGYHLQFSASLMIAGKCTHIKRSWPVLALPRPLDMPIRVDSAVETGLWGAVANSGDRVDEREVVFGSGHGLNNLDFAHYEDPDEDEFDDEDDDDPPPPYQATALLQNTERLELSGSDESAVENAEDVKHAA